MREARTVAPKHVEILDAADPPTPGPGEVLVEIASVGVCGSDIGMWSGVDPYATFPIRQGHEFSARILEFGSGDRGNRVVGQLFAVEPLLPDGTCIACRRGRPNCCRNLVVIGGHVDGALCDRLIIPIDNLFPVHDLTDDLAALVEPISIGLQMIARSGLKEGDQAVIFGAGPIGQAVQLAAGEVGACVLAVDLVQERLARALLNGAEVVVNATIDDVASRIADWTNGEGPVVIFEATGVGAVLGQAIEVVSSSGTIVVAGTSNDKVVVPTLALVKKEISLLGSRNNAGLFGRAVDLVRRNRAKCDGLITHRFKIEETQDAMLFGHAHPDLANKIMIRVRAS
jgi:threonine dehydrogenase-like Zn-dependent dehydrogenase